MIPRTQNGARRALCVGAAILITWLAGPAASAGPRYLGSASHPALNQPIVGMAATPSGKGYWLVAADGGIFTFGDAHFFGSTGNRALNQPIVGMAATRSGRGYWLVAADGGIFTFRDARFFGATCNRALNPPLASTPTTPRGRGRWARSAGGGASAPRGSTSRT